MELGSGTVLKGSGVARTAAGHSAADVVNVYHLQQVEMRCDIDDLEELLRGASSHSQIGPAAGYR